VDITLAASAAVLSAPSLAAAAVVILLDDGAPAIYKSERIGQGGSPFTLYKLRTMTKQADKSGIDTTTTDDPRLLRSASFLRRSKLDEIPQLWNVLTGSMSIVGPRPNVPREVAKYDDRERGLLRVKPGLSCLSSVVFSDLGALLEGVGDANAAYETQIRPLKSELSLFYVERQSLRLDAIAIILTLVAIPNPHRARSLLVRWLENSLPADVAQNILALDR